MTQHAARAKSESITKMTTIVMPADTNNFGHIFGGRVLAMADKVGAMAAIRHARLPVVTASIDRVDFLRPIKRGMFVEMTGMVNAAFNTSMEVGVIVEGETPLTGERFVACRALLTFVAISAAGTPVPVPPLLCETDGDRAVAERAKQRRDDRRKSRAHEGH